ncbi:hypothetical protein CYMTET_6590 [Cymbomonas tetramitiformis]|uniref:Uncharacterized protein n=1 Tax=Cymbomonas tetramitiformis TaxID=36881 RepID=A0AAE0GX87_9CHLO|nr:hypothetical protein CYMTET_6590 [Cymbomonas tetramitiformis]
MGSCWKGFLGLLLTFLSSFSDAQKTSQEASLEPPQLPAVEEGSGAIKLKLGEKFKFENLGPVIINADCTMRRIQNWDILSSSERDASWRRIAKRNAVRKLICNEKEINGEIDEKEVVLETWMDMSVAPEEDLEDDLIRDKRLEEMVFQERTSVKGDYSSTHTTSAEL